MGKKLFEKSYKEQLKDLQALVLAFYSRLEIMENGVHRVEDVTITAKTIKDKYKDHFNITEARSGS